ncbi:MAG TPA: HEAT repeat domain-containing protein, partial [Armatimonadota bacterium]
RRATAPLAALGKSTKDSGVRLQVDLALSRLGDPHAVNRLMDLLESGDASMAAQAAQALKILDSPQVRKALQARIKDGNPSNRRNIADVLGIPPYIEEQFAGKDLIEQWKTARSHERYQLIYLMGKSDDPRTAAVLVEELQPDEQYVYIAVDGVGKRKIRQAVDPLLALLHEKSRMNFGDYRGNLSDRIAWALGEIGDPRAAQPLWEAYQRQTPENRQGFIKAFGQLQAKEAFDVVRGALGDADAQVRAAAAHALGHYQDARAVPALMVALRDPAIPVSIAAFFYRFEGETSTGTTIKQEAAWALGEIGDAQAVEPLIAMLGAGTRDERQAVAEALGKLKDPRAVPALISELDYLGVPAAHTIAAALKAITGQNFGEDSARWKGWWETQQVR